MKIGYARATIHKQDLPRQLEALQVAGCPRIYQEEHSPYYRERPLLKHLLAQLQPGDVVIVWRLEIVAYSLKHLLASLKTIQDQGANFESLHEQLDTASEAGHLIFDVCAALRQFEQDIIRERTQVGLAAARAQGRLGGRPKGLSKEAQQVAAMAERLYLEGTLSNRAICDELLISKGTLYRYLRHRGVIIGASRKKA